MAVNFTRVMRAMSAHPWAILESKLDAICAIVEFRFNGGEASKDEIRAAMQAGAASGVRLESGGAVAVIPISGVIMPRANLFTDFSGGTSLEHFRNQLRKAVADPAVKSVVIDMDSPGGSTYMLPETAAEIQSARKSKRIEVVVNPLMASAALHLGAQADAIVMTPSGDAGSLGVYMVHIDRSKANDVYGYKVTYIKAGVSPHKVEGNPDEPLSAEAQAHFQAQIDELAARFVKDVADGRGLSQAHVREHFGQGRTLFAEDALKVKMVDRIGTLEETIQRAADRRGRAQVAIASTGHENAAACEPAAVDAVDDMAAAAQRDRDRLLAAVTQMEIEHAQSSSAA